MSEPIPKIEQTLAVAVEGDELVIRIGINALITAVTLAPDWPISIENEPGQIVDQKLFLESFIKELGNEQEDGTTTLHRAFDSAAYDVWESGCVSVELPEDPEDEEE